LKHVGNDNNGGGGGGGDDGNYDDDNDGDDDSNVVMAVMATMAHLCEEGRAPEGMDALGGLGRPLGAARASATAPVVSG
jgi:hypothetical protein